ncbi:hypothetical protein [Azospirillum melinis]
MPLLICPTGSRAGEGLHDGPEHNGPENDGPEGRDAAKTQWYFVFYFISLV